MSRNLESLIAQAAELRAAGYTWNAVAQKVRRQVRTCQQWPRRHPFEWEFHYQAARQARFEQIAHEADTHLHTLMRSDDPKVQLKAVELSMRFGAAAYSGLSTVEMKSAYRVNRAADDIAEDARLQFWDEVHRRLEEDRVTRGLPPPSDEERAAAEDRIRDDMRDGKYDSRPRSVGKAVAAVLAAAFGLLLAFVVSGVSVRRTDWQSVLRTPVAERAVATRGTDCKSVPRLSARTDCKSVPHSTARWRSPRNAPTSRLRPPR